MQLNYKRKIRPLLLLQQSEHKSCESLLVHCNNKLHFMCQGEHLSVYSCHSNCDMLRMPYCSDTNIGSFRIITTENHNTLELLNMAAPGKLKIKIGNTETCLFLWIFLKNSFDHRGKFPVIIKATFFVGMEVPYYHNSQIDMFLNGLYGYQEFWVFHYFVDWSLTWISY